jgi:flagellar basal body-associated protein FliL
MEDNPIKNLSEKDLDEDHEDQRKKKNYIIICLVVIIIMMLSPLAFLAIF